MSVLLVPVTEQGAACERGKTARTRVPFGSATWVTNEALGAAFVVEGEDEDAPFPDLGFTLAVLDVELEWLGRPVDVSDEAEAVAALRGCREARLSG